MTDLTGRNFWNEMADLVVSKPIVIDRPRGKAHPRFPELIYPFDYGYVAGTLAADGDGIDVWIGSGKGRVITGILCTYDTIERDAEIKLMLDCTEDDIKIIIDFIPNFMRYLYIPNPKEEK
jgi:inorganic pyrophosphatase